MSRLCDGSSPGPAARSSSGKAVNGRVCLWQSAPRSATLATMIPDGELIDPDSIGVLATPANVRLGRELAAGGEVEVTTASPGRVEARVGGGRSGTQRRRVVMWSGEHGLSWSCSCTNDAQLFCKHLVAAAVNAGSQQLRRA